MASSSSSMSSSSSPSFTSFSRASSPVVSPSPSHQRNNSDTAPVPWYFPGPSSRFNSKHHRSKTHHYKYQRSYTPTAPQLSTANRAHRRVQSSANVPTLKSTPTRSPLSRFSSYTPPKMASSIPSTPSKTHHPSRPDSKLQDSPFSDYFTDDGRSPHDMSYHAPSPETQSLLVRLNRLQSQLMRGERENERDIIDVVAKKIGEIEVQLSSVHAQTRQPPELEDSGLFMDEEEEEEEEGEKEKGQDYPDETPSATSVATVQPATSYDEPTAENKQAEQDFAILEAQRILTNVTKVETLLRARHAELKALIDKSTDAEHELAARQAECENLQTANEALKTENESLRSDIAFDQTELLWLRLQSKALGAEIQVSEAAAERLEGYAPGIREEIQQAKRERVVEEMQRWEGDWEVVSRRMRERRGRYALPGPDGVDDDEGEVDVRDWRLRTVRRSERGEVKSITIDRVESESDNSPEQTELATEPTTTLLRPKPTYTSQSTQTHPSSTPPSEPESWILASAPQSPSPSTSQDEKEDYDACAITTSDDSEAEAVDPVEQKSPSTPYSPPVKTAWQELWHGLSHLAGMGEED